MGPSRESLKRLSNIILPTADFIYILQLEEYYTDRYFKRLRKFFFRWLRFGSNETKQGRFGRMKCRSDNNNYKDSGKIPVQGLR